MAAEHCRTAWLRGRFLARGSLSLSAGLCLIPEFVVPAAEAPVLAARLADVDLPASWRLRLGIRRGDLEELRVDRLVPGSHRCERGVLELEARSVARTLRGELNRVLNAESANLQRSVAAAGRQLEAIDTLDADGRLAQQSTTVRAVAAARRETPEASLSEIAERLSSTVPPSSGHWTAWSASPCTMTRGLVAGTGPGHPVPVPGASRPLRCGPGRRAPGGRSAGGNGRSRLA